jgi:hypothetical protein
MVDERCTLRREAMMTRFCALLLLVILAAPGEALGDDARNGQFGCAKPEELYNVLNLAESSSAVTRAILIAKNCVSLVGAHYLLIGEEGGLAKIRVFAKLEDWASSSIVFTLDDMLDPDEMLDPSAIAHQ